MFGRFALILLDSGLFGPTSANLIVHLTFTEQIQYVDVTCRKGIFGDVRNTLYSSYDLDRYRRPQCKLEDSRWNALLIQSLHHLVGLDHWDIRCASHGVWHLRNRCPGEWSLGKISCSGIKQINTVHCLTIQFQDRQGRFT